MILLYQDAADVSIHAPTGGATGDRHALVVRRVVSIHAPTGGATTVAEARAAWKEFQFTRPRGARHETETETKGTNVSIHAPTGGAT